MLMLSSAYTCLPLQPLLVDRTGTVAVVVSSALITFCSPNLPSRFSLPSISQPDVWANARNIYVWMTRKLNIQHMASFARITRVTTEKRTLEAAKRISDPA